MKFKTFTEISWSLLELRGLLEDEDSCVCFERFKKHLGLHPFHLTNIQTALNEILKSNLNSYDTELKGFLLAYKNPKLLTPLGDIFYDTCFVHVDIEADFYIFRPQVGCHLKGIVNKKGLSHVGVLVHKAFNVSIPKPDDEEEWIGDNIAIGQEIRFTVTHLDSSSKLPFIRGVLDPNNYLEGCRLLETRNDSNNRRASLNNSIESSDESIQNDVYDPVVRPTKPRQISTNDLESTSDEDRQLTKRLISQNNVSKETAKKNSTSLDDDQYKNNKKAGKKSTVNKESKIRVIKMETIQNQSANVSVNDNLESDGSQKGSPKKLKIKISKDHTPPNDCTGEWQSKKEKVIKRKIKTSSSDVESRDDNIKIKSEKSDAANNDEDRVYERLPESTRKSRKRSNNAKHLNNIECDTSNSDSDRHINDQSKERTKLIASTSVNKNSAITIKTEKLNNTAYSDGEEMQATSSRKSAKKHKSMKFETYQSETENENNGERSPEKRNRRSDTLRSENNMQTVNIKKEKLSNSFESVNEGYEKRNDNSGEDMDGSTFILNYSVSEEDSPSKKKTKKRKKDSLESLETDSLIGSIGIKTEQSDDDYRICSHSQRANNTKTVLKMNRKSENARNSDSGNDEIAHSRSHVSETKKGKSKSSESPMKGVKVKKEKSAMIDSEDEIPLNKRLVNMGSPLNAGDRKNENYSEKSPSKHSRKSKKSASGFDFSNINIKVEEST